MTQANDLHNQAMEYVDDAFFARKRGDEQAALRSFEQALAKETAAIDALEERERVQPMYSVLYRSAAALALDCGRLSEAKTLAYKGLALGPYTEIEEELLDVLEQTTAQRHLETKGIVLAPGDVQLSLAGPSVAPDFIESSEVLNRIRGSFMLFRRIAERLAFPDLPFRETNRVPKPIASYGLYLSPARSGSYSVTLRLAAARSQLSLEGMQGPDVVLDEFMDLMQLLNDSQNEELRRRIPNEAYHRNFIALSKGIAPDGERISQVGFTTRKHGTRHSTAFNLPRHKVVIPRVGEEPKDPLEPVEQEGYLRFADARKTDKIKLVRGDQTSSNIVVPEGMMDDIVRPMWGSYVRVTGVRKGKKLILEEISPTELPE